MTQYLLQVVVTYTEAEARELGLHPEAKPPPLTQNFTAEAGAYYKLRLPPAHTVPRTVLNAGSAMHRQLVPKTSIYIIDR